MLMMHGDDSGLILPPRVAPIQAIVVPIPARSEDDDRKISDAVQGLVNELTDHDVAAEADFSDKRPGWKFNEWELKGVPLRIEVGPRDLANNQVTIVRRDTRAKESVALDGVAQRTKDLLDEIQQSLLARAQKFVADNTHTVTSYDDFKRVMREQRGFLRAYWCGSSQCEARIKEETRATIRVIPEDAETNGPGTCICCDEKATRQALFAQSY
jgi:prolyl-tRNA synthetase